MINKNIMFIYKNFKLVESYNFNKICFEDLYQNFLKKYFISFYICVYLYICVYKCLKFLINN